MLFIDREDAGRQLSDKVNIDDREEAVVLALPRGGVPLGIIMANTYHVPFDIILSKKIGHPFHSEYAVGAVSERGEPLFNDSEVDQIDPEWVSREVLDIREKMAQRRKTYLPFLQKQVLKEKSVIIVDDGIATGLTMRAAVSAVREEGAKDITVAVPVIPEDTYRELEKLVDKVIALEVPTHFLGAVGAYYTVFPQVSDEEVIRLLQSVRLFPG